MQPGGGPGAGGVHPRWHGGHCRVSPDQAGSPIACSRGVDLVRVEYIPDDTADIASSVLRLRDRVGPGGFVFTSGGIGATHDDVTYEAIAAAFGAHAHRRAFS